MIDLSTQKESSNVNVGIVGAGLVGCLTALAFAKKGYDVTLFEMRPDPRLTISGRNLRSINLAVSARGINAMNYIDDKMTKKIMAKVIPMKGRMIHHIDGRQESQLYGLFGESINSIGRADLNVDLLNELDKLNVKVKFEHKLVKFDGLADGECPKMSFETSQKNEILEYTFDYVLGTDGAHSQFRYLMQRHMRMNVSQEYVDMQYIELRIPPKSDSESKFSIDANHLHIWPRGNFMLIALANEDGSFTSTFFSSWSLIESIKNSDEFISFFRQNFPDALSLMGESYLKDSFENNPRGALMQVGAFPYHSPSGRAIILGDAAHSMVPFYGQGMNCGFEDVYTLMKLIEQNRGDISGSFKEYSAVRKIDLDTICKLALDNYYEMSTKVTKYRYIFRKNIDYYLGKLGTGTLFTWIPMYTMISFRSDIPYSKAVKIERRQKRILSLLEMSVVLGGIVYGASKIASLHDYKRS